MGKRKGNVPKKVEEERRRYLNWNMIDSCSSHAAVRDKEKSLLQEHEQLLADVAIDSTVHSNEVKRSLTHIEKLFHLHLKYCTFFLRILDRLHVKEEDWSCEVGRFRIKVSCEAGGFVFPNGRLPPCEECWLYVAEGDHNNILYFELENEDNLKGTDCKEKTVMFWFAHTTLPLPCLQALQVKAFQIVKGKFESNSMTLEAIIYAKHTVLFHPRFPSEYIRPNKLSQATASLMEYFYGFQSDINRDVLCRTEKQNIDGIFEAVKKNHESMEFVFDVQHPFLKPSLRAYQKRTVCWMLSQERYHQEDQKETDQIIHPLYSKVTMRDGNVLYYNKHGGILVDKLPLLNEWPPGGLLADEMGLGKTVEVLTCMLLHPRKSVPPNETLPPVTEIQDFDDYDTSLTASAPCVSVEQRGEYNQPMSNIQEMECEQASSSQASINSVNEDSMKEELPSNSTGTASLCRKHQQQTLMQENTPHLQTCSQRCSEVFKEDETLSLQLMDEDVDLFEIAQGYEVLNQRTERDYVLKHVDDFKAHLQTNMKEKISEFAGSQGPAANSEEKAIYHVNNPPILCVNSGNMSLGPEAVTETVSITKKKKRNWRVKNLKTKAERKKEKKKFEFLVDEQEFSPPTFFSDTVIGPKQWFECVCGGDGADTCNTSRKKRKLTRVQCVVCGMWQHAQCLHYNLSNPYRGRYKCPHCHVSSQPLPSGATLIISPFSICHQWEEEIKKHIRGEALKVFIYTGVNKQGFIQPQTLADCDIVITTYETLRKEIDYVDLPHCNSSAGRRFRHRKRFMAIPSPIIAVEWWRICLDEAQMVECTTTKTAEMALRLSGVNRWCVTGTPIQKSVKDLYGLFLFLGMDPYWVEMWWKKLLYIPFSHGLTQPMYSVLSKALWRTSKQDVLDQILLPPQTQEFHWLTFSPVEDHFYRRQYRDCAKEAFQRLNKWTDSSVKLNSMDRHTMSQLLQPLLRLRQACCHPQAVRGEFLPLNKNTMTMEELLESLTKKAKVESEEAHRQLVAAINGQAALHIITQQYPEAVNCYREVLRSICEHSGRLGTDDLQQLHALHNLQEVLQLKLDKIPPSLQDHCLKQQADELRHKYMLKAAGKVMAALQSLSAVQQNVTEARKEYEQRGEWWSDLMEVMAQRGLDMELVQKIRGDIEAQSSLEAGLSLSSSFHDICGLEYCVYTHLSAIERSHKEVVKSVHKLKGDPQEDLVNEVVDCCLRPAKETLQVCCFCKTDELFNVYESKLFSFRERGMMSVGDGESVLHQINARRQGTWADSDVEKTLKSLLAFCKHHGVSQRYQDLLETGNLHIRLLDLMKKEFKALRGVWLAAREQVSAVDELNMATTRLRQRLPEEPVSDQPQPNILEKGEIGSHRMKLVADRANAEGELQKKLGHLLYLTNLAKSQEGKGSDGANPDPCPVCQKALGIEWSVLLCGHCYCLDCMRIMVDQYSFGGRNRSLKCALCRQTTHHSNISYVSTRKSHDQETDHSKVLGSHSTKVRAVVSCIKNIHKHDPTAKALIFSSWQDVLDVIGQALQQNGCYYRALYTPGKFQQNLKAFKVDESIHTLLIPLNSGSKGLNLIEATHVLLVEPILNPAEEMQAIGRVHRIGQTRPTCIHKFLVRGTIEQRIYNMVKCMSSGPMASDSDDHMITVGDLTSLFTEVRTDITMDSQPGTSSTADGTGPATSSIEDT